LAGEQRLFAEVAAAAKAEQARTMFRPEADRLRALLDPPGLEQALASLPVYRTYVEPATGRVEQADRDAVASLPERIRRVLLLEERGHDEFVTRFQQTTGAIMAKGVEDTAFYRFVRLVALNEVGGNPGRFGLSVEAFHAANRERQDRFPQALLAGTTHDTKRSADVRARIGAISTMAEKWSESVRHWHRLNEPLRSAGAPDWTEELLLYQTLAGAWPIGPERLIDYLTKAAHEEKRHTSWVEPNETWDKAIGDFCRGVCANKEFLAGFVPFAEEIALAGERSAIGQLVVRLTAPGVPDVYGGDELWYLALVDPDNRRPIDWGRRRDLLAHLTAGGSPQRETVKLAVIHRLLALRARHPTAFENAYEPIDAPEGTCAFRRGDVIVAVPVRGLVPQLDHRKGSWRNILDGIGSCLGGYEPLVLERVC
jgi:(1->4)-alpha-D-glucan 1-alpha-D-glucosylmutase